MQLGARTVGGIVTIQVTTGGSGYTSAPTVAVTGGGGTGVTAFCQMNGSVVSSVCIASRGTGFTGNPTVSFSGGGGTGAAATAIACTTSRPMTFFKAREADVYGVDGMGRGVRWDGSATTAEAIGLNPPALGPNMGANSTSGGLRVTSVQIINGGVGYSGAPQVTFTGGTPTRAAVATATVQGGRVTNIVVSDPGAGYQAQPSVSFSGGIGAGCTLGVAVLGAVTGVAIISAGTGYSATTPPTVSFSTGQGLTGAQIVLTVDSSGRVSDAVILATGTGATTSGVTASVVGGSGTGCELALGLQYRISSITVGNSGSGYYVAPAITVRADPRDPYGTAGAATASVDSQGRVTAVTVLNGGDYALPPTASVEPTPAEAQAETVENMSGEYQCCVRYLDDTPESQGGPRVSSISPIVSVAANAGAGSFTWTLQHGAIDDRVSAMELYRTTADQSVLFFRVATIQRSSGTFTGAYTDSLNDDELSDPTRGGYALLPLTLPSGQINARRFGVPPGEFAVACMFQDRAWYAVDSTGRRPNALMYSEVDEPESVPAENELILQENSGEPDSIAALVPLGGSLLVVQSSHIYKLTYVAQPVIDASLILVANRGVLHSRCWASMSGVAFLVDSNGMYAFDGTNEEALSVPVDNYWREGRIDFSKSHKFHVSADLQTKTVRFHYCTASDTEPLRALCYCVATKAWWEELYADPMTTSCRAMVGGRMQSLYGKTAGFCKASGTSDAGTAVPYRFRTGAVALSNNTLGRSVDVLFSPTATTSTLKLALHYNNSPSPRPNAIATDRGGAFVTTAGGTAASLNLAKSRSPLGEASGQAKAYFSGRIDDRSVGADRHVAIDISGEQTADQVTLHGIAVDGAG